MTNFHDAQTRRRGPRPCNQEARLPLGLSAIVIGSLSALSWGAVVLIFVAIRSVL